MIFSGGGSGNQPTGGFMNNLLIHSAQNKLRNLPRGAASPAALGMIAGLNAGTAGAGGGSSSGGRSGGSAGSGGRGVVSAPRRPNFTSQARTQANREIQAQMAVIQQAIKAARDQAARSRKDFEQRGKAAKQEIGDVYGLLGEEIRGINQGISSVYADNTEATEAGAQALVDAIVNRSSEATEGVENVLSQAGIQGVGTEGMSDNMAVGEMIARNLGHTTTSNAGLMSTAADAMGGWNLSGAQTDQARRETDVTAAVNDMIAQLENQLAAYLAEQEGRRLEVEAGRGSLERQIAGFLASQHRGSGGGGGGFSSGRSSGGGGAFRPNVSLPSDAIPVTPEFLQYAGVIPGGPYPGISGAQAGARAGTGIPTRSLDTPAFRNNPIFMRKT